MFDRRLLWVPLVAVLAVLSPASGAGAPAPAASAKPAPVSALTNAQAHYDQAQFAEAITVLRAALGSGELRGGDELRARALLARCQVKQGDRVGAKESFKAILRRDAGFRLDSASVPPDELDVFAQARGEFDAERIETGQRVPASLSFELGGHSATESGFKSLLKAAGGGSPEEKLEFGGSVRFPIRDRVSLDIEIVNLRSTKPILLVLGTFDVTSKTNPLVANVYWTVHSTEHTRLHLFAGAGPARTELSFAGRPPITGFDFLARETSIYAQTGAEGEYMLHPRLSLSGRVLARSALSKKLDYGRLVGQSFGIGDPRTDYRGFAGQIGLRAYIGY